MNGAVLYVEPQPKADKCDRMNVRKSTAKDAQRNDTTCRDTPVEI